MGYDAQNFAHKLPANIPTRTRCVQLQIPDDPEYFQLFYGALDSLSTWNNYDRDTAHSGRLVARLWRVAIASIRGCPPSSNNVLSPCDCDCCGGCMTVRFNGCVLEQYDCTTQTWIPVPNVGMSCVSNPAPGSGTTPPAAGKCTDYVISHDSRATTLLPFNVNTGDTIQLETVLGAATDGSAHWYCPDGSIFLFGACAGGGGTLSGDPLPTANHMALLWKIGANYYPINSTLFTVPSGVTNSPIYIQDNDTPLTNNVGTYNLKFNFCNNQSVTPTTWCHADDFTISPSGWSPEPVTGGADMCGGSYTGTAGQWSAGGWHGTILEQPDCVDHYSIARIQLDLGAAAAYTIEVKGSVIGSSGGSDAITAAASNDPTFASLTVIDTHPTPGTGAFDFTGTLATPLRYVRIYFLLGDYGGSGSGVDFLMTSAKFTGTGTNPFGSSNC